MMNRTSSVVATLFALPILLTGCTELLGDWTIGAGAPADDGRAGTEAGAAASDDVDGGPDGASSSGSTPDASGSSSSSSGGAGSSSSGGSVAIEAEAPDAADAVAPDAADASAPDAADAAVSLCCSLEVYNEAVTYPCSPPAGASAQVVCDGTAGSACGLNNGTGSVGTVEACQ